MTTPQEYIDESRKWVGTPFKHRGRICGGGVDCIGVVYEAARAVSLLPSNIVPVDYSRDPDGVELTAGLKKHLVQIRDKRKIKPGDVLLFRFLRYPQHGRLYRSERYSLVFQDGEMC